MKKRRSLTYQSRIWLLFAIAVVPTLIAWRGCGTDAHVSSSPPASKQSGLFADITQAAGIDYRWTISGKSPLNILETIGNGCAFLDYNNDGNLDILLVGPKLALYRGDGHGHFTDVTHQTGLDKLSGHFLGCAVGDYDNDGFDDIYLTAYRGGALLHNEAREEGRGKREKGKDPIPNARIFKDVTQEAGMKPQPWGTSAAFVDVDNDGKLDLYICNYVQFGPNTNPQLCVFGGILASCSPRAYQPEHGALYHNEGNGKFRDVTRAWNAYAIPKAIQGKGLGVACADFNGSGRESIALANDEVAGDLLLNTGKGFKNIGVSAGTAYDDDGNIHGGMGEDWGDYDNDGKLDLVVGTFWHEVKDVYHNEGGNHFSDKAAALGLADKTQPFVAFGLKWIDYDNDGWLDLMIANGHVQDNASALNKSATYKQLLQLFHNNQGKVFDDRSALAGPAFQTPIVGRGLAIGDFDNDGRIDVLVVDSEGSPLLLRNQTPQTGHWLLLKLEGTKSNRDGIGAQVTVTAGDLKQIRLCHTDGSYMSASDRRIHVGLGPATTAIITVHWPSGRTDTYKNIAADRIVTLKEGMGQG